MLLAYLAIDLSPFVPGALSFTPEEGLVWVEGVSPNHSLRAAEPVPAASFLGWAPSIESPAAPVLSGGFATPRELAAWLVNVRTDDPPPGVTSLRPIPTTTRVLAPQSR
jgi:hypothetical protein